MLRYDKIIIKIKMFYPDLSELLRKGANIMGFLDKVKGVADTLVDSVEKGAKNVSETSKKTADKMRIKKEITKYTAEVNKGYNAIGQKYFELHADSAEECYSEFVNNIVNAKMKLSELNAELLSLENKTTCSKCGKPVAETDKFCAACGAVNEKYNADAPAPQPAEIEAVEAEVVEDDDKEENE